VSRLAREQDEINLVYEEIFEQGVRSGMKSAESGAFIRGVHEAIKAFRRVAMKSNGAYVSIQFIDSIGNDLRVLFEKAGDSDD